MTLNKGEYYLPETCIEYSKYGFFNNVTFSVGLIGGREIHGCKYESIGQFSKDDQVFDISSLEYFRLE